MSIVDLRSDTVARPGVAMRHAVDVRRQDFERAADAIAGVLA